MTRSEGISQSRLCIDANDVALITAFWVSFLGYRVLDVDNAAGWRHLDPTSPNLPKLSVQPVPEHKDAKNRLHLDIFVTDPGPWIDRGVSLGGRKLWMNDDPDDWYQVLADPEGNEFCICLAD